MAQPPLIGIITNPNSRKNRLHPGRYEDMKQRVGDLGLVRRTHHTGEIAEVVRDFLDLGIPYWVADGGDGAFHWLTNVLTQVMRERGGKDPMPALMPTNAGTIDFIGRKAGVVGDADALIAALCATLRQGREPEVQTIGSVHLLGVNGPDSDLPGRPFEKVGFACALAGLSQRIFDKFYAQDSQNAVGLIQVVIKTLVSAATQGPFLRHLPVPISVRHYSDSVFEPMPLDVWIDGEQLPMRVFRDCDVGAIDINLAGVFRFFPFAGVPGKMHVQCGNPGPIDVLRNLPYMATGKPLHIDDYFQGAASSLKLVARDGRRIDPVIDGELYWGLTEITAVPGPRIRVVRLRAK
jgi:hypothetical protein